ncbi:efflux RND transporter periplasmic adaptor subunit [candidate division KSB1 bacterium]|nr:MAG: efflux RND transporter periplasmic adaptor subunit [candidate division KSB1 bacterium]MBC6948176.1 efflux RND transporter periplasmic adaptor subunit [candidate division KSB1 bacterium]MCE7940584.1 efflux RND transporter periplasmic adaptor subunit [Chlorobi bacterium CHB1]MDL1875068.1 efflux RND transporter periplasmic adaptor subunit [Cytophagia bacterium CHB2]
MIMNPNFNQRFFLIVLLASLTRIWSCSSETQTSASAIPPAKVANGVKESELTTVTLSPEAEQRLGIETAAVEKRQLARRLRLGGEIVAIPGRRIFVTAPVAGVIVAPNGRLPQAGMRVRKGQAIFSLLPLPAERDLLGSPDEVVLKKMQFDVAQAKAQRAAQLLHDNAGSVKTKEEADTELLAAAAAFKAAEARLHLANSTVADSATLATATMALASPFDGVLQKINIAPRQTVAAGAELFEVVGQNTVWVRVPVYVGDLATIDEQQPAQIEAFGDASGVSQRIAKPVQGPPLSDANAASADLFFEMENSDGQFRVGEKVRVTLAQKNIAENLIVPFSAILYDIHGGTWVYTRMSPHTYTRQRVELHHVVDTLAVLARGPDSGTEVVITGAAEIFGTEFGGGK